MDSLQHINGKLYLTRLVNNVFGAIYGRLFSKIFDKVEEKITNRSIIEEMTTSDEL